MRRREWWLWLLALCAVLSKPSAAAGQDNGYWRHEGETLRRDFKNIDTTCVAVKTDWAKATFGEKIADIGSCGASVQGNAFIFNFGQAPPNNEIGLGLAVTDGDPVRFKDAQGRQRYLETNWKIAGDVSTNASWTGYGTLDLHFDAILSLLRPKRHVDNPFFHFFSGSQKAQTLAYFGEGQATQVSAQTNYSLLRTTLMGRAEIPVTVYSGLKQTYFFGLEMGERWYSVGDGPAPDIGTVNNGAVPGLFASPTYFDQSLVIKVNNHPTIGTGITPTSYMTGIYLRHTDDFEAKLTNRDAVSAPQYSYRQFWLDEQHQTAIRCRLAPASSSGELRPRAPGSRWPLRDCFTLALEGSITETAADAGKTVPFFLQPTVGGSDIDNNLSLPSYANYRFRAPDVEYANASFLVPTGSTGIKLIEKIPFLGFMVRADTGKAALRRDDLSINHMRHSFSAGVSNFVGNAYALSLFYSWAGPEGSQFQKLINPQLLGKGIADYWWAWPQVSNGGSVPGTG
jgi:hypothetical protein